MSHESAHERWERQRRERSVELEVTGYVTSTGSGINTNGSGPNLAEVLRKFQGKRVTIKMQVIEEK